MKNVFVDASALLQELTDTLSAQEKIEYRYYDILGNISRALVDYRIAHDLNQKQLSRILGVTQSMVSKYESGDYNISIRALNELCGKLDFALNICIESAKESARKSEEPAKVDIPFSEAFSSACA